MIASVFRIMPVYSLCSLCFQCLSITAFSARLNNSVVSFQYKYCTYLSCDCEILNLFCFEKGLFKTSSNFCVAGIQYIKEDCNDVQE